MQNCYDAKWYAKARMDKPIPWLFDHAGYQRVFDISRCIRCKALEITLSAINRRRRGLFFITFTFSPPFSRSGARYNAVESHFYRLIGNGRRLRCNHLISVKESILVERRKLSWSLDNLIFNGKQMSEADFWCHERTNNHQSNFRAFWSFFFVLLFSFVETGHSELVTRNIYNLCGPCLDLISWIQFTRRFSQE